MIIRDQHGDEMAFVDVDGDVCFEGKAAGVTTYYYAPREARRIAAEIIACADRIEGKDKPVHSFRVGDRVRMVHPPRGTSTYEGVGMVTRLHETDHDVYVDFNGYEASGHQSTFILVSRANTSGEPMTVTYTQDAPARHNPADLATLAKAIAYLPGPERITLNALLATRIGEVLG